MRTTNTFSILFWIYETRAKNDLANIYVRITVNGKKVNMSLKQKVLIQNWNKEKQRAKGKDKVSQIVNQHLDQTHSKLVEIYHELKFQDKYITAELKKPPTWVKGIILKRFKISWSIIKERLKELSPLEQYGILM